MDRVHSARTRPRSKCASEKEPIKINMPAFMLQGDPFATLCPKVYVDVLGVQTRLNRSWRDLRGGSITLKWPVKIDARAGDADEQRASVSLPPITTYRRAILAIVALSIRKTRIQLLWTIRYRCIGCARDVFTLHDHESSWSNRNGNLFRGVKKLRSSEARSASSLSISNIGVRLTIKARRSLK